jgi:CopG-like RHH_1 or ribbon-helix-helix domain, RHH_5
VSVCVKGLVIDKDILVDNHSGSPHRISITVPDMTFKKLLKRSLAEKRSLSNLASFLLQQSLEEDSED